MAKDLTRRIIVAAIGIPAAVGLVYLGGWVLAGLLALFGVVGTGEIFRLAERGDIRPLRMTGYLGAAALPFAAYAVLSGSFGARPVYLVLGGALWVMAAMADALVSRQPSHRPLAATAVTVFGATYAGGLPAFLLVLRHAEPALSVWAALWLVCLPLVVTWVSDTAAMAGGSLIGGRRLAPVLSPNKTWAGAISGSVGALLLAPAYGLLAPEGVSLAVWKLAVFGLVISVVGQGGDVAESLIKREVGVKDSGTFFPGHGGVLDRFDSLYWAIPTSVLMLMLFGAL